MMLLTKLASSYLAAVKSTHAFACTDEAEQVDGLQREAHHIWQAFIDLLGILKRYRAGDMDVSVDISNCDPRVTFRLPSRRTIFRSACCSMRHIRLRALRSNT